MTYSGFVNSETASVPVGSATGSVVTSGGLAPVEVAEVPAEVPAQGQRAAGGNANGFMNVFVVLGGINMDRAETQPATAR